MTKKVDLTGYVFGDLTVVGEGEKRVTGKKRKVLRSTWKCRCVCGNEIVVLASNLRNKNLNTTSCGCKFKKSKKYNFVDLTGNQYGFLTVIKKSEKKTKTRGVVWECQCDCGTLVDVSTNSLTSGNKVTCGDKILHEGKLDPRRKRCGDLPLSHVTAMKQNAVKRNLRFDVSPQYLWDLFVSQNGKCVLSGMQLKFTTHKATARTRSEFTTASLDRIDSFLGYIEGNVRWVHKDLNIMRGSLTDTEFFEYCRKCFLYQYDVSKIERPTFDEYFLNIAFNVSLRSDDPNIRHGAVIVNRQNHIIGTGYNATIRGSDKSKIPYNIRDKKRLWMIHAEENAILNCTVNPLTIGGAKLYVTGLPCVNCLQRVINFGIFEIIHASRAGSITENEETQKMRQDLISMSRIKISEISLNNVWLKKAVDSL